MFQLPRARAQFMAYKNSHKPKPVVHSTRGIGRPPTRRIKEDEVQEAQPEIHTVD